MYSDPNISVSGGNRGVIAGRDVKNANLITTGDIAGSYNAIGVGAQVVINQIQQVRSAINELGEEIRFAELQLANAVTHKVQSLTSILEKSAHTVRRNPYRSLLDYQLEDAPFFYGRDVAIHELLSKIHEHRLTILHSDSGAGKSSLLQAGLMSRLMAAGHLPLRLRPYRHEPAEFIKKTFLSDVGTMPELERFRKMSLVGYLEAVTGYLGDSTLYLFLDQFEEFFTELPHEVQEKFAQELADCLDNPGMDVRWVLSLRKEYFSDLRLFQPRVEPFVNEYFLSAFNRAQAKSVVVEPARRMEVTYESETLVEQIIDDLIKGGQGNLQPPQVQLVCHTLFEEVLQSPTPTLITETLYEQPRGRNRLGKVSGILGSHLSRELEQMPAFERRLARKILEELITSQTRRTQQRLDALLANLQKFDQKTDPQQIQQVLAGLVDSYLLRRDEDEHDDHPVYELAHDYLLTEIEVDPQTLARKAAQELLNQEVVAYQQFHTLLSADKYKIIDSQRDILMLSDTAAAFLNQSQAALEAESQQEIRQLRQRLWLVRGLFVAVLAIAIILAVEPVQRFFWNQWAKTSVPLVYVEGLGIEFEAYEVTNERYAWCVQARICADTTYLRDAREEPDWEQSKYQPARGVDVEQAMLFCQWIGRTLPTAEQWIEVAPPLEEWKLIGPEKAVFCRGDVCPQTPLSVLDKGEIIRQPQYIAVHNKGETEIFDLVGNVREWTRTSLVNVGEQPLYCKNVNETKDEDRFVLLGDTYEQKQPLMVGDYKRLDNTYATKLNREKYNGFRCVENNYKTIIKPEVCPSFK